MSNASAASRAATSRAPAAAPDPAPELPFDHPERLVAALFAKDSPIAWKLPIHLSNRFPHLRCAATVEGQQLSVRCVMPVMPATAEEQSRFRLPPDPLALSFMCSPELIQGVISACLAEGIACDALDAVTRIVGMALSQTQSLPRGARPFVERWMAAVRDLTSVLTDMWWQGDALTTSRERVHKVRALIRAQADDVLVTWVEKTRG